MPFARKRDMRRILPIAIVVLAAFAARTAPAAQAPAIVSCDRWNVYTGGFRLRRPACVPLLVRVGGRERRMSFALSPHC